ncbi:MULTISPECIES: hypothetical protein [unclassified Mesorhizobium]|uniref:hypothetical protein n=1 Tax=unclassified Mesorhizobium TaxID=325217 RepID=UPI00333B9AF3
MSKRKRWDNCGLCGEFKITTREHVVPKCLYPPSKATSKFQRIIIAACSECNNGTADDDAHFRNVILVAGDATDAVNEIWHGAARRAFAEVDGKRRLKDLFALMKPAPDAGPDRYRIYPADDERILRIVRKVVRGLSKHHGLPSPIKDHQVFADVMRFAIPGEILGAMHFESAEPDIFDYRYLLLSEPSYTQSIWVLRFFQRTSFVAMVLDANADN